MNSTWRKNYSVTLEMMANAVNSLRNISESKIIDKIIEISLNICESRIDAAKSIGKNVTALYEEYNDGKKLTEEGDYDSGFQLIKKAFSSSDMLLKGQTLSWENSEKTVVEKNMIFPGLYVLIIGLMILVLIVLMKKRR